MSVSDENTNNKVLERSKFLMNELVLCYEPDPNKARVLYDAKILDKDVTKDDNGKKAFEYYIHFQGWNKSWDRWVLESQILKISEANRAIQSKLYDKALEQKKRKTKANRLESDDEKDDKSATSSVSSDDKVIKLPLVSLDIPKVLTVRLEDDCYNIKRKKKLIHLPRKPSVNDIFNEYYAHAEKVVKTPEGRDTSLNLIFEVVQGLNTYFNYFLFSLLLYNFEREQYHNFFPVDQENRPGDCSPTKKAATPNSKSSNSKRFFNSPRSNSKASSICEDGTDPVTGENLQTKLNRKRNIKSKSLSIVENDKASPSKRNRNASSCSSMDGSKEIPLISSLKNVTVELDGNLGRELMVKKTEIKEEEILFVEQDIDNETSNGVEEGNFLDNSSGSLAGNGNRLRRSVRSKKSTSKVDEDDEPEALPIGSSAKSLQKMFSRRQKVSNKSQVLKELNRTNDRSFMIYPQHSNGDTPADVYGMEHLLRLFVKLPILLASSSMEETKTAVILQYVSKFLEYLSKRTDLFVDPAIVYSESII